MSNLCLPCLVVMQRADACCHFALLAAARPAGTSSCQFGINWTLLHDPQAGQGTGAERGQPADAGAAPALPKCFKPCAPAANRRGGLPSVPAGPAPLPRKGHAAAMQDSSRMVIHGGRSDVYGSFTDVWAFSLASNRWEPLPPARAVQPTAREHHGAALYAGRLFIFGGRYGEPSYRAVLRLPQWGGLEAHRAAHCSLAPASMPYPPHPRPTSPSLRRRLRRRGLLAHWRSLAVRSVLAGVAPAAHPRAQPAAPLPLLLCPALPGRRRCRPVCGLWRGDRRRVQAERRLAPRPGHAALGAAQRAGVCHAALPPAVWVRKRLAPPNFA